MKKVFFAIAAIVATMTIASCGNGTSTQTGGADSTATPVDSVSVTVDTVAVDTTAAVK
jgi:hypothetical protein